LGSLCKEIANCPFQPVFWAFLIPRDGNFTTHPTRAHPFLCPCYNRVIIATTILFIALYQGDVDAQSGASLRTSPPVVDLFPTISLYLSLTDSQGHHIPNLSSRNFVVLEEGQPIHGASIEEQIVGTRQVFIINTSRNMRGRDSLGLTRFDYVRRSLFEWWSLPGSSQIGIDDLSLLTDAGTVLSHTTVAAELAASLSAFQPEYLDMPATIGPLLDALDYVTDPPPRLGMATHIIFITPLILEPEEIPLTDTIARANQTGTRNTNLSHPCWTGGGSRISGNGEHALAG
jgi:hypothetical protein